MWGYGLDSCDSGSSTVAWFCKYRNKPSNSAKDGEM